VNEEKAKKKRKKKRRVVNLCQMLVRQAQSLENSVLVTVHKTKSKERERERAKCVYNGIEVKERRRMVRFRGESQTRYQDRTKRVNEELKVEECKRGKKRSDCLQRGKKFRSAEQCGRTWNKNRRKGEREWGIGSEDEGDAGEKRQRVAATR
jgi:hypothetical protein